MIELGGTNVLELMKEAGQWAAVGGGGRWKGDFKRMLK